jgi:hypothetical protein
MKMIQLSLGRGGTLRTIAVSVPSSPNSIGRKLKRTDWSNPTFAPKKRGSPLIEGSLRTPVHAAIFRCKNAFRIASGQNALTMRAAKYSKNIYGYSKKRRLL